MGMEMMMADIASTINLVRLILVCVLACRSIFLCLLDFIKLSLAGTNLHHISIVVKILARLNHSLTKREIIKLTAVCASGSAACCPTFFQRQTHASSPSQHVRRHRRCSAASHWLYPGENQVHSSFQTQVCVPG